VAPQILRDSRSQWAIKKIGGFQSPIPLYPTKREFVWLSKAVRATHPIQQQKSRNHL
jgi:hypothetical protein